MQAGDPSIFPRKSIKKVVFFFIVSAMVFVVAFFLSRESNAQTGPQVETTISVAALQQIQALTVEKESRTPAQKKIDSQLLFAARMRAGLMIADGVPTLMVDVGADEKGLVEVAITAFVEERLLSQLAKLGVEIKSSFPAYHSILAAVPLARLEDVASLEQVRFIQPKQGFRLSRKKPTRLWTHGFQPLNGGESQRILGWAPRIGEAVNKLAAQSAATTQIGTTTSEGDVTHRAISARGTFNVDGSGVKIGVISDGANSIGIPQASGDLGEVTFLPGQGGFGNEGTAMLEIIHDLAPGAQLYFATGTNGITQFAQNIRDLRQAGCDIIVDDIGYYVESPFQDGQGAPVISTGNGGIVTQAVNDVVSSGALYFSAAGNSGNKNDDTSSAWEGDFINGGPLSPAPDGFPTYNVNDFDITGGLAQFNTITVSGSSPIALHWADPLGGSANDYDLYVLGIGGGVVGASTNSQTGTQDPFEEIYSPANHAGFQIVIVQKPGTASRFLHLDTFDGQLAFSTTGEIFGHAAASRGIGIAAVPAVPTYPNSFSSSNEVEPFSSGGPRRTFFVGDGTPITPGNFSATGGTVQQQPVLTAADGVSISGAGGFSNPFYGTSAAAPHAAAIAALIKSANPTLTSSSIRNALISTAIDIEAPGVDPDSGYGIVMPYPALLSLGGPTVGKAFLEVGSVTQTETCCNGDGFILPGETGTLDIDLKNTGLLNASGITATLTTSTPGVTINNGTSVYSDIPSNGHRENFSPFAISLNPDLRGDTGVKFTLTVSYNGGHFPVQTLDVFVQFGFQPIPFNPGANSSVYTLAIQPDGKILVGGKFAGLASLGGVVRNGIGRLNTDGTIDAGFDPGTWDTTYGGDVGRIYTIAVQPDGKILIGGRFTRVGDGYGSTPRSQIARLNSDGTVDTDFNDVSDTETYSVMAIMVQADGKILIGGEEFFESSTRGFIRRLNTDGSLDPGFRPDVGGGASSFIPLPNGKIIASGSFTTPGNGGLRSSIVRLNSDGTFDPSFGPTVDHVIQAVAVQPDGKILVTGTFNLIGGVIGPTTLGGVGRLSSDGVFETFFEGSRYTNPMTSILQTDQKVISGIARFNVDGSLDNSFDPGANNIVNALAVQSDGLVVVGGDFTTLGRGGTGQDRRNRIGRVSNTSVAVEQLTVESAGTYVTWLRSGTSPEVYRVTFESSIDGTNYTPLGNGIRINGGWQLTGLSLRAQDRFIRARGFCSTGFRNGSGSIVEAIKDRGAVTARISGRVLSPAGTGIRNVLVSLTNSHGVRQSATTSSFGFYALDNVPTGETYTINIASRLFRFGSKSLLISDDLSNLDFVGLE